MVRDSDGYGPDGHMELFSHWVNPNDHSQGAYVYSFNTTGETVRNPSTPSNFGNLGRDSLSELQSYTPIRYNNISEGAPAIPDDVTFGLNADGRLEVFYRNPNGGLMTAYQTTLNGAFSGPTDLEGTNLVDAPAAANNADGRLQVFVRNGNGGVMTRSQTAPNGAFSSWVDLGGVNLVGSPAVTSNADGRLEMFARNGNGAVATAYQTAPNGGWSTFSTL